MRETSPGHVMTLALQEPIPEEVDAGADFSVVVSFAAPSGCDLRGAPFKIVDSDCVILAGELPSLIGEPYATARITVTAPQQIADFTWTFVLPAHEIGALRYENASLDFSFKTRPHATSLAVWDHPSPVVVGNPFGVKVGAKCTAGCRLVGKTIEIQDETGTTVASVALGEAVWPGTRALYWGSVDLQAPAEEGCFSWAIRFSAAELQLPHCHASALFSFVTVGPPDHGVSITVVEKGTHTPIHDAQVSLGIHRTSTDETGVARFAVRAGDHSLSIWKAGYDTPERIIHVTKTEEVSIEMVGLPEEDPFAFWQGMSRA